MRIIQEDQLTTPLGYRVKLEGFGFVAEQIGTSLKYRDLFETEKKAKNAIPRILWKVYCSERYKFISPHGEEDFHKRASEHFGKAAYLYLAFQVNRVLGGKQFLEAQRHIDWPVDKKTIDAKLAPLAEHFEIIAVV